MQKRANRILSALIALVMVLSMLPATVFADGETENVLEGWSIALGDNIGVKFYLNSADYTVSATVNGAEVIPSISGNIAIVSVAAAQMNDPIVLTVKNGDEIVHTDEYSVREYAETILTGDYADYVKAMVKEMLNYGAAAQTYFDYNDNNLANAGYELESSAEVPTEVPAITVEDNLAGISLYGMSLVFRNKTAVRFYFNVTGDISSFTFSQGEPVEKDGMYYVEIGDINPQDLANDITLSVNDGALSVTYSPLNYIVRKYNNAESSTELKNLVQAMYGYHLEAKYYCGVIPVGVLQANVNGHGAYDNGIYFSTQETNDAPYDPDGNWEFYYNPASVDCLKLVRDGKTYSVGLAGRDTICKFSANNYALRLENYTIGDYAPYTTEDIFIVEGEFTHKASNTTLNIEKTYIYYNGDSESWVFASNLPVTYNVGVLQASVHGAASGGIYFATAEVNDAPWGDWNTYFDSQSVDNIKLIRNGETISIGLTDRNTICKFGQNDYYLRIENWTIGDYAPYTTDDMFIVEGAFTHKDSKTTLNIAKTYIYHDGSAWVFSANEPAIEPETESPFTFDKGVFSADIFNNRNNGLSVSVENQQLKLQRPEGADNWLWIKQDMPAGTVVTMDVTFSGDGMNLFGYGSKANGDPITEGTVTESVPQGWFWGQGGSASGSYTFNIYEDCYGLSLMLGFANSTETAIYIDNVVIVLPPETESPFTFDGGSFSADIFNNRNNGLSVSVENKQLKLQQPEGASNWLWIKQTMKAGTTVTMDVTFSGDGMNLFGYGSKANGDPITEGTVTESVPQGWFWGQGGSESGSYTFTIYEDCYGLSLMLGFAGSTETAIYIDNVVITAPEVEESTVVSGGNMTESTDGWDAVGDIFFTLAENDLPIDENAEVEYAAQSGTIKLVRGGTTYEMVGTVIKYDAASYYLSLKGSENLPLQDNDYLIVEGNFTNADNGYTLSIAKTYILVDGEALVYSTTEPDLSTSYDVGVLQANVNGHGAYGNGIYFSTQETNDAPYAPNGHWEFYYNPASVDCLKLVRDGKTYSVGLAGRDTICKFSANDYALRLENYTIGDYAPYTTDDIFIVEGAFTHKGSNTTLNIEKTYIFYDGSAWVFSATEPVYEPETVSPFTFNKGVFSADIFNNRNNGLSVSVENKQLKLQQPEGASNWLWIKQDMPAGTVVTMDVTFSGEGMNIFGYGSKANGDPITEGTVTESVPQGWFWGQGGSESGSYTFNIYEDCYGLSLMLGFANSTETAIYIDNVVIMLPPETESPFTFDGGSFSADIFNNRNNGLSVSVENQQLKLQQPEGASNWLWIKQTMKAGTVITMDVTFSGDGMNLFGYGSKANGDPITEGTVTESVPQGWFWGQGGSESRSYTITIYEDCYGLSLMLGFAGSTETAIYIDNVVIVPPEEEDSAYEVGVLASHSAGVNVDSESGYIKGIYAVGTATEATYDTEWTVEYTPVSAENYKLIRGGVTYNVGVPGAGTLVLFSQTDIYLKQESHTFDSSLLPLQAGDILVVEGKWSCNQDANSIINITKTYISITDNSATFSAVDPRIIHVGAMFEHNAGYSTSGDGNISGIYFRNTSNAVPANGDWSVRYAATKTSNVKLIRDGQTTDIAIVDQNTIVKMNELDSWLCLESSGIISTYPIKVGDVLVVEGAFTNSSNGYTMVIDKTYIIVGSDGVTFTTQYAETDFGSVILPTSTDTLTIGVWNGSHHVFADKQLKELQAAGITKITGINTAYIGTDNVNAWLDRVYSYGISVIFDLRDWDGTTVPEYANHPGVLGFLMYDEPGADVFDDLATLKAKFDAVMPADKLFYVNLFPECAADSSLGTESSWWDKITGNTKDYDTDYVTAFLNALNIQVLSWDNYSLITNSSNREGIRTEYFHNFEVMASKNLPMWYTMLSAGHTAGASDTYYATPTAEELRWQMAVAMTYGVQNIDHYVYASHEDGYSCMVEYEDADGDGIYWETTALYDDIKKVDNEYLAWDNIFMAYDWQGVGVYDTGSSNAMLTMLENKLNLANYGLTVTSSNQDLLVGVFDHNGDKAYMVTNAGTPGSTTVGDGKNFVTGDATVTLNLGSGSYKCVAVIDNGEISYVAVNADNTVTLNVQAYEGVFVIPVQN